MSFNENTPAVQLIRATAWSELGFTLAQAGSPDGGKLAAQGYQIATDLYRADPNLDGVIYAMGRAAEVMGQLSERSDATAAYNYFREANDALGKCLAKNPNDTACLHHEFMVLGRIGNILYDGKQYDQALAMYQKSLDVAEGYARLVPPGPDVGLSIGGRYNHLGRVYMQTQDMTTALQDFRQAEAAMAPWANDPKASTSFLLELANTDNSIANVLAMQAGAERDRGKLEQAISYTEHATGTMELLAASDPGNLFYWSNLAIDYDNLSFLNEAIGNRAAEETYARKRQDAADRAKTVASAAAQKPAPEQ